MFMKSILTFSLHFTYAKAYRFDSNRLSGGYLYADKTDNQEEKFVNETHMKPSCTGVSLVG